MPSSGSVISSRVDRRKGVLALLLLSFLCSSGCPKDPTAVRLPEATEKRVAAIGDGRLRRAMLAGSPLPFAVVARFSAPIFPDQTELLADLGIPPVESAGRTALLVATAAEISALLSAPSLEKIRFLGSQSSLARIHPELEIGLLRMFDLGKEHDPVGLLVRFRSPPEAREAEAVAAAGFRILSPSGIAWAIEGPLDRLPALLAIDEIIYVEGASKVRPK